MKTIIAIAIAAGLLSSVNASACLISESEVLGMQKRAILAGNNKKSRQILKLLGLSASDKASHSKVNLYKDSETERSAKFYIGYEWCSVYVELQYTVTDHCRLKAKILEAGDHLICVSP